MQVQKPSKIYSGAPSEQEYLIFYIFHNMHKGILALVIVGILGFAGYMYFNSAQTPAENTESATYSDTALGLAFDYPTGDSGYVLEEKQPSEGETKLLRTVILMESADHARITSNPPVGGEGPPVIAIHVFKNEAKQFPLDWAMDNQEYSNYNLKMSADESELVIGGANAIGYMADGLYASENVIVAHGEYMYVITGQFLDTDSKLRLDFKPLLESVRFVSSESAPAGRININAVCEGALAYMTFPDGEAAEKFLTDCKEGKHPEVIQQYIDRLGLDGATI